MGDGTLTKHFRVSEDFHLAKPLHDALDSCQNSYHIFLAMKNSIPEHAESLHSILLLLFRRSNHRVVEGPCEHEGSAVQRKVETFP
jgi:hypothetical protein